MLIDNCKQRSHGLDHLRKLHITKQHIIIFVDSIACKWGDELMYPQIRSLNDRKKKFIGSNNAQNSLFWIETTE